jgi:hypothetical protein
MAENFTDSISQFTDSRRPKEVRLMAARGLVPATPKDLTLILYFFTKDADPEVAGKARETLSGLPSDVVSIVLTYSEIVLISQSKIVNEEILRKIAESRK